MNQVNFFEGSDCFRTERSELTISEGFVEMVLARQYEYRPTTQDLWAEVRTPEATTRYQLIQGVGVIDITQPYAG
jgi:hypothetical protein